MQRLFATLVFLAVTAISSVTAFASSFPAYGFGVDTEMTIHINPRTPSGQYALHYDNSNSNTSRAIHFNPSVNHGGGAHINPASAFAFNSHSGFAEGEHIGTLTVHRLGRTINIYEGETMRNMDFGAGRFSFSGANSGNTALIGHNRGRSNGFFSFVMILQEGDLLTLDMNGISRTYAVSHSFVVSETDFTPLMEFGSNRLTLVTCEMYRPRYRLVSVALEIFSE